MTAATTTAPADAPTAPSALRGARRGRTVLLGAIVPLLLLGLWQALSAGGVLSAVVLPGPGTVLQAGADLLTRGDLWVHIGISTQRVLLGFFIGAGLGLVTGAVVGLSDLAARLLGPTLGAIRAVPSLAWAPLLLLWVGLGETSKVTLVAIGAFFPVLTTVSSALQHVDAHLVEAGRAFGLRRVELLRVVQLPAAMPSVVSGLRLALAQGWLFLVAAEIIGASMGLGFLLTDSQYNGRTDRMLLAIILLAVVGKLTDALLGVFERWTKRRWA